MFDQPKSDTRKPKKPYEKPTLTSYDPISEIVLGGGGKLSVNTDDQGDIRKPPGQEPN